jgi:hypothetical protein
VGHIEGQSFALYPRVQTDLREVPSELSLQVEMHSSRVSEASGL